MAEISMIDQYFTLLMKKENDMFDSSKHVILLTFDDNYVNQTINLILSIAKYHSDEVSYICMCPELKQENICKLLSLDKGVQIRCYDFWGEIDCANWPICSYFRVFAPWLLEESIHKVLYMDSDIICAGSIEKLLDMDTSYIAMCPEIGIHVHAYMQRMVQEFLPTQIYCNSGVCVFNLDALRHKFSFEEVMSSLVQMRPKLLFPDQDFLNFNYKGHIEYLNSYMYNFIPHELKGSQHYKKALNNARLIHFASTIKPWKHNCELYLMRIYLNHTTYPPMIKLVKKKMRWSYLHAVLRLNRPIRRWYYDTYLVWKKQKIVR